MGEIPRGRGGRIAEEMRRCAHFSGVQHPTCKAGVSYAELAGGKGPGWVTALPCLSGGSVECDARRFPTRDEATATIERGDAAVAEHLRKLAAQECTSCGKSYEGKQVGRCVYCEHCNARQYQGTVSR